MTLIAVNPLMWAGRMGITTVTGATMNAAGESCAAIGYLHLIGQTGSKTLSSAGGVIYWNSAGGITFANAGTNIRIGIQDVTTGGVEDGTFDVFADLVGGTDTIANNTCFATPMESGSKTMAHGDLIAVCFEMTTRGGVADVVTVDFCTNSLGTLNTYGSPWGTADTGGGPAKNSLYELPLAIIKFDDGTYGWIAGAPLPFNAALAPAAVTFNQTTTPDEYCAVFQVPVPLRLDRIGWSMANVGTADTFEIVFYTDPLGTPVAARTLTIDPDYSQGITAATLALVLPSVGAPLTLAANTDYGVAVRATSNNNIQVGYYDAGSGFDVLKVCQPFTQIKMTGRTDQTGPFVVVQDYHTPDFAISICALDDGTNTSGGSTTAGAAFVGSF